MTNVKTATLADILKALETFAPCALAEDWDNPGLQVGDPGQAVTKIWTALDPMPEIIAKATAARCDLLLTHHPLFFHPVKSINFSNVMMRGAVTAIKSDLAIIAAHTNLDSALNGVNFLLAEKIGLLDVEALIAADTAFCAIDRPAGLGRVGNLPKATTLGALAADINAIFGGGTVRVAGNLDLPVARVAVCGGSGGSLMSDFIQSGAQVFVSGDFGYHQALEAEPGGYGLIDLGHFRSEHIMVEPLAEMLRQALLELGFDVTVEAYKAQKEPFKYIGE